MTSCKHSLDLATCNLCWYEARRDALVRGEDPDRADGPKFAAAGDRSPYRVRSDLTLATERNRETDWDLLPGSSIVRSDLHDRYGGSRRGGISPCSTSHNVLVFSDPSIGNAHGYYDRWDGDMFLYCGEGQQGNQEFIRGNAAIRNHRRDGRAIRLFEGATGTVSYAGEFALDVTQPYFTEHSHASGGGPARSVIIFRMVPLS